MWVLFIGTGASEGVPVYGCGCDACREARRSPVGRRRPSSLLVFDEDYEALVVDMGTDHAVRVIDYMEVDLKAVLLTHWHHDHYVGLYMARWMNKRTPLYAPGERRDPMLIGSPGSLEPRIIAPWTRIEAGAYTVEALPLSHGIETYGYLIRRGGASLAVLFDTYGLPEETRRRLAGEKPGLAIIDATFPPGTPMHMHNDVDTAIKMGEEIGAGRIVLTHISHRNMPHTKLVEYVRGRGGDIIVAHDNMMLEV